MNPQPDRREALVFQPCDRHYRHMLLAVEQAGLRGLMAEDNPEFVPEPERPFNGDVMFQAQFMVNNLALERHARGEIGQGLAMGVACPRCFLRDRPHLIERATIAAILGVIHQRAC